jgi:hypothetical protein
LTIANTRLSSDVLDVVAEVQRGQGLALRPHRGILILLLGSRHVTGVDPRTIRGEMVDHQKK